MTSTFQSPATPNRFIANAITDSIADYLKREIFKRANWSSENKRRNSPKSIAALYVVLRYKLATAARSSDLIENRDSTGIETIRRGRNRQSYGREIWPNPDPNNQKE
ncbi:uncharacterized protein TrAtP1_002260 [Trichoderma atroviride]|uniref:uncharacterized protein n=1 Tax=Hypocrea atroviridis TaxID=63577 RepID=UPI0033167441|nr:hypothetical protein TrAtP1_002260 [Trichoderma atroviride]